MCSGSHRVMTTMLQHQQQQRRQKRGRPTVGWTWLKLRAAAAADAAATITRSRVGYGQRRGKGAGRGGNGRRATSAVHRTTTSNTLPPPLRTRVYAASSIAAAVDRKFSAVSPSVVHPLSSGIIDHHPSARRGRVAGGGAAWQGGGRGVAVHGVAVVLLLPLFPFDRSISIRMVGFHSFNHRHCPLPQRIRIDCSTHTLWSMPGDRISRVRLRGLPPFFKYLNFGF